MDAVQAGSLLRVRGTRDARRPQDRLPRRARHADDVVRTGPARARQERRRARARDGAERPADRGQRRRRASLASRAASRSSARGRAARRSTSRVVGRRVFLAAARQARVDLLARAADVGRRRARAPQRRRACRAGRWAARAGRRQHGDLGRHDRGRVAADRPLRVPRLQRPPGAQAAQSPAAAGDGPFDLVDHKFPVRGKHNYGTGHRGVRSARNGHSIRATTSSPPAARRSSPLAAAS